jgi:dTDP-glucose 4,6-dehydratase
MKLLVTGSAGFIGTNFVRLILRERPDWSVVSFDKLTYAGNPENLEELKNDRRHVFVQGDIADPVAVRTAVETHRPDAIINFAAETHVDRSIHGHAAEFVQTNVIGTQVLLEAVKDFGVSKYLHISTDEVFGDLELFEGQPFTETTPYAPSSPYAASKASSDLLVRAYHRTYGLPVLITNTSNNYGPYQFPEKLIPYLISLGLKDQPLPVYGDGLNVRDWIHVEDHCSGILAVLERGTLGETYNIGATNEQHNIVVVMMLLNILGKPSSLLKFVTDRPGHDRRYAIDSSKIQRELGWRPKYGREHFAAGLRATVEWYQAHPEWIERALGRTPGANNPHITL